MTFLAKLVPACATPVLLVLLASSWVLPVRASQHEVRGKLVEHTTRDERVSFGEDPSFRVGFHENKGLMFFENGEVAAAVTIHTFEGRSIDAKSAHAGYRRFTFEDGSTQVIRFEGTGGLKSDEDKFVYQGTYEYIHGSGRFVGIQGGGSYSGKSYESVEQGAGGFGAVRPAGGGS